MKTFSTNIFIYFSREFFDELNPMRDWLNKKMKEIDVISKSGTIDPELIQKHVQQLEVFSV